jgi:hypothetical protein
MVLQTKVFLIVLLQNYSPFLSRRKTFIKRVQQALEKSFKMSIPRSKSSDSLNAIPRSKSSNSLIADLELGHSGGGAASPSSKHNSSGIPLSPSKATHNDAKTRHEERLLTSLPFPVPRRAIHIRPRVDKDVFGSPAKAQ